MSMLSRVPHPNPDLRLAKPRTTSSRQDGLLKIVIVQLMRQRGCHFMMTRPTPLITTGQPTCQFLHIFSGLRVRNYSFFHAIFRLRFFTQIFICDCYPSECAHDPKTVLVFWGFLLGQDPCKFQLHRTRVNACRLLLPFKNRCPVQLPVFPDYRPIFFTEES